MEVGTRVQILPHANYSGRFTGFVGTIVYMTDLCADKVGVQLDKQDNPRSKYNAFWFDACDVAAIESEDTFMQTEKHTIASVKFLDGSNHGTLYSYALYDSDIQAGDIVVVKTGHHGFALAEVVEVAPETASAVQYGREIVSKVDFTAYNERKATRAKLKKLKQQMDAKVKELQATALYEMLAEKDPELSALLADYKAITKKEEFEHV